MSWKVDFEEPVKDEIKSLLNAEALNQEDVRVLKRWVDEVETEGLDHAQTNPTWRDHELQGNRHGQRAISFSYSGRLIYRTENEKLIVMVVKVTPDHDYK